MITMPKLRLQPLALLIFAAPALMAATTLQSTPENQSIAPTEAAFVDPDDALAETTDDFRIKADSAERMTLPVEVGGLGPYAFIIDTGSHRSIIATEIADQLALPALAPVQIVSMAGRRIVTAVQLQELRFGTQVVSDIPALTIDRARLGGAGLIGLDSLQDKRLTLDFRKRTMEVSRSTPRRKNRSDPNTIVVRARSQFGQLILVGSHVDGRKVSVIVDTGAEFSIGNMALFKKLKQERLIIPPTPVTLTSVTGDPVQAQFTIVRRVNIESLELENVPMVFLDAAPFDELGLADKPAMLLGMKMLRLFDRVAIDFGSKHVDFELPQSNNDRRQTPDMLAAL